MIKYLLFLLTILFFEFSEEKSPITHYGSYIFIKNVVKGQYKFNKDRITLIINANSNDINKNLSKQIDNWEGPISIGIFIDVDDIFNLKTLCTYCTLKSIPNINNKTSIHFIFPYNAYSRDGNNRGLLNEYFNDINCEENIKSMNNICHISNEEENEEIKIKRIITYPINTIKNIARKQIKTKYMVFADINDFFSQNFEYKMSKLIIKKIKNSFRINSVLVYRNFEVDTLAERPKTKKELIQLINSSKAFIFDTYLNNTHQINKLEEWFYKKETLTPSVQYVTSFNYVNWDPNFVSDNKIPYFDERFGYPLNDRIHLKWHLCRKEYKFLVVNDAFMYHYETKNYKEKKLFKKAKSIILPKTVRIIKEFNKKMYRLYPRTVKLCPRFEV
ncbi:N-acetyllactosaminide beta-1,3-N-acetylglucosaminyltransferase [Strongyloides ratti]|uniref:N-acetyllactosaminide beta-1,3-N-acetylglucosaminyltransferase n=1 Tax=Strongyloides ratti TaxID=34506 RepID=A0A090LF03_STRRB|nr:N-acetyllactosaminide beta-1,3-N-acetylglucosaminyltransferase [Strongyloides ratti]CEF68376.1 N-acetyllactosaminide beta-1,3-N-acetylglucosaminyltransferase [Strongyloides ratti]